jgi:hypothetical protein
MGALSTERESAFKVQGGLDDDGKLQRYQATLTRE